MDGSGSGKIGEAIEGLFKAVGCLLILCPVFLVAAVVFFCLWWWRVGG